MFDEEEDVAKNHYMVFDRPHVYKCRCGYVQSIFPDGDKLKTHLYGYPSKETEYLACGHATCARLENGECVICRNTGGLTQLAPDKWGSPDPTGIVLPLKWDTSQDESTPPTCG